MLGERCYHPLPLRCISSAPKKWRWSLVCFFLICIYFVGWLVMPSAYFFLLGCSSSPFSFFSFFFWCWATNVESWGNDIPLFMHIGPFHPDFWFPSYCLSPPPPEASFLVYPFTCIVTYVLLQVCISDWHQSHGIMCYIYVCFSVSLSTILQITDVAPCVLSTLLVSAGKYYVMGEHVSTQQEWNC